METNTTLPESSYSILIEDSTTTSFIISEPDFKRLFLSHLLHSPKYIQDLYTLCLQFPDNPYMTFVLGLIYEYGLLGHPQYKKAKEAYFKAANDLNSFHACYRLHFAYNQDYNAKGFQHKLGIMPDNDMAYAYLIRAAAYCTTADNRICFKQLDPSLHLYHYCEKLDNDQTKAFEILKRMGDKNSDLYEPNHVYLSAWFQGKYQRLEQEKNDPKVFLTPLLEKGDAEASYYMGEIYRYFEEDTEENIQEAIKYFEKAAKRGCIKAKEALIFIYLDKGHIDGAFKYIKETAEAGSYIGLKFMGEFYLLDEEYLPSDEKKGLGYLKQAFLLADFWALFSLFIYYKQKLKGISDLIPNSLELDVKHLFAKEKKWEEKVYRYSEILYSCREIVGPIVHETIRYGNIAECYEKGIYVERDYKRALRFYEEFLAMYPRERKLAYIYYRMGVIYRKMGMDEKARELFSRAFQARTIFMKSNYHKETLHYYNYAKMFEKGLGIKPHKELARINFHKGATQGIPTTFFTKLYRNKCQRHYEDLMKETAGVSCFKVLDIQQEIKSSFSLRILNPHEIMQVGGPKVILEQLDIEVSGGIYGSVEDMSIPLRLSKLIKINKVSYENYIEIPKRLCQLVLDLKEIEEKIQGARFEEVYGIALLKNEKNQIIVGKEMEEFDIRKQELDKEDICEKYLGVMELLYQKGWKHEIFSVESLQYKRENKEKKELLMDIFPFVLSIYQEIKGEKEKVPTIKDSIISLLIYLREMKRIRKMKPDDFIDLMNFRRELDKCKGSSKDEILTIVKELSLSSKFKKKICKYFTA